MASGATSDTFTVDDDARLTRPGGSAGVANDMSADPVDSLRKISGETSNDEEATATEQPIQERVHTVPNEEARDTPVEHSGNNDENDSAHLASEESRYGIGGVADGLGVEGSNTVSNEAGEASQDSIQELHGQLAALGLPTGLAQDEDSDTQEDIQSQYLRTITGMRTADLMDLTPRQGTTIDSPLPPLPPDREIQPIFEASEGADDLRGSPARRSLSREEHSQGRRRGQSPSIPSNDFDLGPVFTAQGPPQASNEPSMDASWQDQIANRTLQGMITASSRSGSTRGSRAVSDTSGNNSFYLAGSNLSINNRSGEASDGSSASGDNPSSTPRSRMPQLPRHRSYRSVNDVDYRADRVILPRWQPDAEVDSCPICGVHFSFFVRKHHCRKCGRVVCNACSPHRITIPYAYIVRPPPNRSSGVFSSARLEEMSNSDNDETFSGGESVRLCNPCVPDPQIEPPRPSLPSRHSRDSRHTISSPHPPESIYGALFLPGETRAAVFPPGQLEQSESRDQLLQGSRPYRSTSLREAQAPGSMFRHRGSNSVAYISPGRPGDSSWQHQGAQYGPQYGRRRPSGRSRNSDASLRAARIPVDANAFYGFGQLHGTPPYSSSRGHRRYGADADASNYPPSSSGHRAPPEPQAPLRINLEDFGDLVLTYIATARDCAQGGGGVTDDLDAAGPSTGSEAASEKPLPSAADQQAECIICLEEFEPGTKIALMQCLCKFHASCLEDWWQIKPRCCPLHDHDK